MVDELNNVKDENVKEEMKKFNDSYGKQEDLSKYSGELKDNGVNRKRINNLSDANMLKQDYKSLFMDNAKLDDERIMEILVENREKLKDRFSFKVKVDLNGKFAGEIEVEGLLVEDAIIADEYIKIDDEVGEGGNDKRATDKAYRLFRQLVRKRPKVMRNEVNFYELSQYVERIL